MSESARGQKGSGLGHLTLSICLFIYSFIHPATQNFTCPSSILPIIHPSIHPSIHSLTHPPIHSTTPKFIHPLSHHSDNSSTHPSIPYIYPQLNQSIQQFILPPNQPSTYSSIYHSSVDASIPPSTCVTTPKFTHYTSVLPIVYPYIQPLTQSFVPPPTHPSNHLPIYPSIDPLTPSTTPKFIYSSS